MKKQNDLNRTAIAGILALGAGMMALKKLQAQFCLGLSPFGDVEHQARAAELIQPLN